MTTSKATYATAHIPPHEPVFVIRAQDKYAPDAIAMWIALAKIRFGWTNEKIIRAEARLAEIVDWQQAHPELVKVPD